MMVHQDEIKEITVDSRILAKLDRNKIYINNTSEFVSWLINEAEKQDREGVPMVNLHVSEQALDRLRSKRIDRNESDSSVFERLIRSVFGI